MEPIPVEERAPLADKIRVVKELVAEEVTEQFFRRHPEWLLREGDRGRQKGIEDVRYHLEFLAGSIETGSNTAFKDYASWTAGVRGARGIASPFLAENLLHLNEALTRYVSVHEAGLIAGFIQAGCDAIEMGAVTPGQAEGGALALTRRLFVHALLQGQRKPAAAIALEALQTGHAVLDIYVEVLQSALYSVGTRWAANEITVAQEHTATAITQYVLALLYERLKPPDNRRGKAIITGVEGELHQVGGNMVADALETDGWDVRFLGTNMPHEGILHAVQEHGAGVVGISATMLFNLPKVRALVDGLRQLRGDTVRILVGGGAFRTAPNLYAEIGADGFAADLRGAITLLRGMPP